MRRHLTNHPQRKARRVGSMACATRPSDVCSENCTLARARWTLEELAKEVGVSRSILAERFAPRGHAPPMPVSDQPIPAASSRPECSREALLCRQSLPTPWAMGQKRVDRAFKAWLGASPRFGGRKDRARERRMLVEQKRAALNSFSLSRKATARFPAQRLTSGSS